MAWIATPTARTLMAYKPNRANLFSMARPLRCRRSEDNVAAIDDEGVAGVVFRGVAGEIHGDPAEIFRLAPAAHRNAWDDFLGKCRRILRELSHFRRDPARSDRIGANAKAGVLDCDRAHHGEHGTLGGAVGLVAPGALQASQARDADKRAARVSFAGPLHHMLASFAQREEHAFLVHGVHTPPDLKAHLAERRRAAADAGVGEHGVEPAHIRSEEHTSEL